MSDHEDYNFNEKGENAPPTTPLQCSELKVNDHVMLKGRPCKIVNMSFSTPGKHGHAKVHLVGIDLITDVEYEDVIPSTSSVQVPLVEYREYQLIDIVNGHLSLMADTGEIRDDLKVPENDLGREIRGTLGKGLADFIVTVVKAVGEEAAIGIKDFTRS